MTRLISKHWHRFLLALMFLTRLPVKLSKDVNDEDINQATAYFSLVGGLVGLLSAFTIVLLADSLPLPIVVVLSMMVSLLLTGAFHEDGLADTADGFGGGWQQSQKLTIMKDSRIGTYGASALIFALLLKYQLLIALSQVSLLFVASTLIFIHALSRFAALLIIPTLPYVQLENEQKTKPVAQSISRQSLLLLLLTVMLFAGAWHWINSPAVSDWLAFVTFLIVIWAMFVRWIKSQIQGYTGDVLGAAQQVIELSGYIGILLWLI